LEYPDCAQAAAANGASENDEVCEPAPLDQGIINPAWRRREADPLFQTGKRLAGSFKDIPAVSK
jgi:hypothetical protein